MLPLWLFSSRLFNEEVLIREIAKYAISRNKGDEYRMKMETKYRKHVENNPRRIALNGITRSQLGLEKLDASAQQVVSVQKWAAAAPAMEMVVGIKLTKDPISPRRGPKTELVHDELWLRIRDEFKTQVFCRDQKLSLIHI